MANKPVLIQEGEFTITQQMLDRLDKFFGDKTVGDVDRNTFLTCSLIDVRMPITLTLMFMQEWDNTEWNNYEISAVEEYGAVFIFPCYWIDVPKELVLPYIVAVLRDFYNSTVRHWNCAKQVVQSLAGNLTPDCGCNGHGYIPATPVVPANPNPNCPVITRNV